MVAQNQTKNPNAAKHKEQRVAVFVDVQNMYYSAKNLYGAKVDFAKVLKEGVSGRKLVRAFAYVIKADVGAEKEFHEALSLQGFEVRIKELQVFFGGAKKGDWDVGLCMDTVRMMPKIDVMVLVSGDGDYVDLIEYARSQGVRTEVVAFDKTASGKLVEMVDAFTNMGEDHKKFLIGQRMFIPKPPRSANQSQDNSTPSIV
ncbi:NYN domain-containing protein [Patescibacteria group bacterium]|nr:NYN domain-containing protein [Patescibacteria group bacterium]